MFFSGKNLGDGLHREEYEGCGDCDEKKGEKFKILTNQSQPFKCTGLGQEFKWRRYTISKYLSYNQANKLLNKMCSLLLP